MKKADFINMLQQDIETQSEPKKSLYAQVIDCTVIALLDESADFEVDGTITCESLFGLIEKKAKETRKNCIGPFEAAKLIAEHLKTENDGVARLYNMVMGLAAGNVPTPRKCRISLDDI